MKFPLLRLLVAAPAIASSALLSPACADAPMAPPPGAHADFSSAIADSPSKLDYLVFASLADSSRLPTLTADRAPESVRVGRPRD
jgi:hypothetical protein